jgi:hypothetical protein
LLENSKKLCQTAIFPRTQVLVIVHVVHVLRVSLKPKQGGRSVAVDNLVCTAKERGKQTTSHFSSLAATNSTSVRRALNK